MPSPISRANLRLYLRKCRHRRSEENQGTDDPCAQNLDALYTDEGTYYLLSGVVPTRGPGGFLDSLATGLSPTSAANGTGVTLTVNGQYFRSGAVVYYDGVAQPTTFVSATQLTATIANVGAAGKHVVQVYQSPIMSYPASFTAT